MNNNKIIHPDQFDYTLSRLVYQRRLILDSVIMIFIDAIILAISLIIGNLLLFYINGIEFSITNGWLILPIWTIFSVLSNILPGWGLGSVDEFHKIQKALFLMFGSVLIISFLSKIPFSSSRIVFLFTYFFAAIFIPVSRLLVRSFCTRFANWGVPVSIYGKSKDVSKLIKLMKSDLKLGYYPISIFTEDKEDGEYIEGVPVIRNLTQVNNITPLAIVIQKSLPNEKYLDIIGGPAELYHRLIIIPEISASASLWVSSIDFQGILGLEVTKNLLNPVSKWIKIISDFFFVILLLPLWLPLIFILFLLIFIEDQKNPFFLQERIGKGGKIFKTIKFRTMVPNAENVLKEALKTDKALYDEWNNNFKLKKDPRITKIGNFLRITSLDELPQLFNVLGGKMSVVGPRPLPLYHFNDLPGYVQRLRNQVKPGITGMWQVSGRSESGTEGMERWDPYYVRNWSIWLDIIILYRTVKAVVLAKGAY